MMVPVHPLSTYNIGTAMPGPVDKAELKFKLKDCSPLYYISRLWVNLKSDIYAKKIKVEAEISKSLFIDEFKEDIYR